MDEALDKVSATAGRAKELRHPPTWLQASPTAQCHLSARGQGLWVPRPCLSQTSRSYELPALCTPPIGPHSTSRSLLGKG